MGLLSSSSEARETPALLVSLKRGKHDLVQRMGLALSKETNRAGTSLPSPEDKNPQI
jgi:hypothetical protein